MKLPQSIEELHSYAQKEHAAGTIALESPDYTPKEQQYLAAIRDRLSRAKRQRDQNFEQFDGMTYVERCQQNRRIAQTAIKPRSNRAEIEFSTGSPRAKLLAQLAHLNNLNLQPDVTAYDDAAFVLGELGEAMENILEKQAELQNDEEHQMLRRYVLFEQGEVFVERHWKDEYILEKKLRGKFNGKFRGVEWTERMKKAIGGLKTNIIRNEYVYLGDITKFNDDEQPYKFTRQVYSYADLEPLFKDFEMWKYVSMSVKFYDQAFSFSGINGFNPFWAVESVAKGFVECIKYQDKPNNEFQIFLNGVPMFPVGFPMPWKHGNYSIVKQVSEIIDPDFAYGKSLIQRMKMAGAMEDEMWRNVLLMFQQMLKPPMVNNTGQVLSSRIFMPGVITNNIPADKLKPLLEGMRTGMKGEAQVLQILRDNLNDNSTDPTFVGKTPEGNPTATEINTVQVQAEKVFGQAILVSALLEQKLARLGVDLILKNYFDPIDTKVDEIRNELKNVYRRSNVEKPIEGRGMGQEIVMVAEQHEVPSPYQVFEAEKEQEKISGMPTRIVVLNRDEIMQSKYAWRIKVIPSPRRTTNLQKLMFREEVETLMLSPNFNWGWFEEKAAVTYGENPQKVFMRPGMGAPPVAAGITPPGGAAPMDPKRMMPGGRKPGMSEMGANAGM